MALGASRKDQLIALARDSSPEARGALLRALTDLFVLQAGRFKAAELHHFDIIMSRIAQRADAGVRREIAVRLTAAPAAPAGLINQLARDSISVAEPVLRSSGALADDDLIAIIRERRQTQSGQAHMKAIARRREASPAVTGALVDCGGEDVLIVLAKNHDARLNTAALQAMAAKARKAPALQEPLLARYDLPPQALTQLYFHVGSALRKEILKRAGMIDPCLVEEAVTANRHKILNEAMGPDDGQAKGGPGEAQRFIAEQIAADAVNERLIKILLAENRQTEFLFAFAHHIGVDLATARVVLNDKTFESLAIAGRAVQLEHQTFAKIAINQRDGGEAKALGILSVYNKIPADAAERIMRFWRLRTEAAIDAARIARLSGDDDPLPLTKRADGW